MKLYTNNAAVPSRMLAFTQLLALRGERPTEDLKNLLHPKSLRGPTAKQFEEIAEAARECGLVTGSGAVLKLSKAAGESLGESAKEVKDKLPVVMGNYIVCPKVGGEDNRFARICTWMLMKELGQIPQDHSAFKEAFTKAGFDRQSYYLNNDAAWDMVIYWMRYVGLISRFSSEGVEGVIPDPTRFLRYRIDTIFSKAKDGKLTAGKFRSIVGKLCPVLDGGSVWKDVRKVQEADSQSDRLSAALTFALKRLRSRKIVEYGAVGDQRDFLLTSDGEQFTHVKKL